MTKEDKILIEYEKEQDEILKQMQEEMLEQAEKDFEHERKQAEKDLEPMYKQAKKEWRMWQKEKADAERQAHLRGEYTEADYQKDLALYLDALQKSKQR